MKDTALHIEQLSKIPFFDQLSTTQLQRVARETQSYNFYANELVRQAQDPSDAYWILLYGSWKMERFTDDVSPLVYETDKPGTWHGGIGIIDAIAPAKVTATSLSTILQVPVEVMQQWVLDGLPISHHLLAGIAGGAKMLKTHQQKRLATAEASAK